MVSDGTAAAYQSTVGSPTLNASRLLLSLLLWQLPAVLHGVPLPLLAQEVLQLAALLQLLVFFSQLQFFLLSCRITTNMSGSTPMI